MRGAQSPFGHNIEFYHDQNEKKHDSELSVEQT